MNNQQLIASIADYINGTIIPRLQSSQNALCKGIYNAMVQDGYKIYLPTLSDIEKQLPHTYWEITNMGEITSTSDDLSINTREHLRDILLGEKEYDIQNASFTVEDYYVTRGFTEDFKDVYDKFRTSKQKGKKTAMGIAVEELVAQDLELNRGKYSDVLGMYVAENLQIKAEGKDINLKGGDFKIGYKDKLLGHIDIKYSEAGPNNAYRYMNMIHIHEDYEALPISEITKIIEGYTYHGKKHARNMVLIYIYPDDGYWATFVVTKVRDRLLADLRKANKENVDLSKATVGGWKHRTWYAKNK
jgi:hypothetical protein